MDKEIEEFQEKLSKAKGEDIVDQIIAKQIGPFIESVRNEADFHSLHTLIKRIQNIQRSIAQKIRVDAKETSTINFTNKQIRLSKELIAKGNNLLEALFDKVFEVTGE